MKKLFLLISLVFGMSFFGWGQTNPTAQALPYSQNFSSLTGSSPVYPAGFQGWTITGSLGTSYSTSAPNGDQAIAVVTNTSTSAHVGDFVGKMGMMSTGSAIKAICLAINTTGFSSIQISFDAATQRTENSRQNEMGLQYRIGTSGTFTNIVSSTYLNQMTPTNISGTVSVNIQTVSVTLPSAVENQTLVQLRWIIRDVSGSNNRPGFSIDNISITANATGNFITTGNVSTSPFCVDASTSASGTVAYTSSGTYSSATFTAYLSDATGVFGGSPPNIGTATVSGTDPTGSINITIPAGTASGTGYKIRIDCSSPAVTGSSSGAFEIINGVKDVSTPSAGASNASSVLSWTNPSGCFDEIMIVAKAGSSVTANPTGNGSLYTYNLVFGTGGSGANLPTDEYCVYKGTSSPQTVTGLTNGTNYNYKFFTRKGTNWSAGIGTSATPAVQPSMIELVIPKYIGSKTAASTNNARTPVAFCIQIDNLNPSTAYDIRVGLALTSEDNSAFGAGNVWKPIDGFGGTNTSIILNAFTTNSSGSSGQFWIIFQPTGNGTHFDAGQVHNLRIGYVTNGGTMPSLPNFVGSKTITALDIANTARTPATTDDGAFIKGTANAGSSGKYILLFDNGSGTGDPLFAYQIRTATATNTTTQSELPTSINDVYLQSGTSSIGDYPAVIPIGANNPNGVRRIEARNADNTIYSYNTDADGIWFSGANTTTAARRDVITLTNEDAPVYPTIWNGSSSSDWDDAGNWDNGKPSSTKNAVIPMVTMNPVIGNNAVAASLNIFAGATLTINSTSSLKVNGIATLGGSECLIIKSNSSGTASFIDQGIAGAGTAKVERYLTNSGVPYANEWHGVSSPVSDATSNVFLNEYLMLYNESVHAFEYIQPVNIALTPAKGYFTWVNATSTKEFTGHLNTGNQSIAVSRTWNPAGWYPDYIADFDGWNMVGNPYPSTIDLSLLTGSWINVEATAWFWNPVGGNYKVYPSGGGGSHNPTCPPEQGFFVHCNAAATTSVPGSGTVKFTNAARTIETETFLKSDEVLPDLLKIRAQGFSNGYYDELSVYFDPSRTNNYEPGYDALKFSGNADAPQIYTLIDNSTKVSVNAMVFDKKNIIIPMGFYINTPANYTLIADNLGSFEDAISIHLEDLKLNTTQDLRINPVYNFTYDTLDDPNRFVLHFGNPYFGVNDSKNIQPVQIYSFGNAIYIQSQDGKPLDGTVFVYDLIGKELLHKPLSNQALNRITPGVVEGYYLVRVVTGAGTFNGKVYLKN
jgi:hypothetical protein